MEKINKNVILTVFTPTYNRAYTLHKCYESLLRQTCKDFKWLIIDDGSTDNTKDLVEKWVKEADFEIKYVYKENGGMHTAHNTAYENIDTELNSCIDSDDYMPDDAVEKIIRFWQENSSEKYAGIVGLDITIDDKVIGTKFPDNLKETTLRDFYAQGGQGDKKLVYRTKIVNKYSKYPIFKGEKYFPVGYKYSLIDKDYKLLILNDPLVIIEYLPDGITNNKIRKYRTNPLGFAFLRQENIRNSNGIRVKFRNAVHLVSTSIFLKNYKCLVNVHKPLLILSAIPLGVILNIYIRIKTSI